VSLLVVIIWDKSEIQGDSERKVKIGGGGVVFSAIVKKIVILGRHFFMWYPKTLKTFFNFDIKKVFQLFRLHFKKTRAHTNVFSPNKVYLPPPPPQF